MTFFLKRFLEKPEARIFLSLLLREIILISIVTMAISLTLESILPGTVSVRSLILFFILGLSIALMAESHISKTIPAIKNGENMNEKKIYGKKVKALSLTILFSWVILLIGSASIGFPPLIIFVLLILTPFLLWLFLKIIFDPNGKKKMP